MPLARILGDYDIECLVRGLRGRESEDALAATVPEPDDAFAVGVENGVRRIGDDARGDYFEPDWRYPFSFSHHRHTSG
jgi:hypothetical protein